MEDNRKFLNIKISDVGTYVKNKINSLAVLKLIISIVLLLTSIPIASHYYWIFETSYLSALGVDPENFSRPIFSSNAMNAILFFVSIVPVLWLFVFVLVMFFIGVFLDGVLNYFFPSEKYINRMDAKKHNWLVRFIEKFRFNRGCFYKLSVTSILYAMIVFIIYLYVLSIEFIQNEGFSIAKHKMSAYLKENPDCIGSWSRRVSGCYTIEGVEGEDHYVILNNDTHIVFLSRELVEVKDGEEKFSARLHIKEKTSNKKYETSRSYKPYVPKVATE